MLEHKKERMERHISLMKSERTGILWKSEKVGQTNLNRLFMARKNSVTVDLVSSVKSFEKKKMAKQTFTFQLGTQVSEYARSVSHTFLCALKANLVNFELP